MFHVFHVLLQKVKEVKIKKARFRRSLKRPGEPEPGFLTRCDGRRLAAFGGTTYLPKGSIAAAALYIPDGLGVRV